MSPMPERIVSAVEWRARAEHAEAEVARLRSEIQEATVLLDFEANLGPREHQATLRAVVEQLTAALESGAM